MSAKNLNKNEIIKEQYEAVQKELDEVKIELDRINKIYFKDGHY